MQQDSQLTDGEIIECVRGGDVACFELLVERYQQPLFALALSRLNRREWAEEAVQEAFLCAYRWLDSYDSKFAFRTWLWTILLNQCKRFSEKENRVAVLETHFVRHVARKECDCERAPSSRLEGVETERELREAMRALPDAQADALRLRFFGGLRFDDIAQALGCSLRTAKYRVKEGLIRLQQILTEQRSGAKETREAETTMTEVEHAL
jgi:RNA polymerase sigma-70 factor, ECF subfamily